MRKAVIILAIGFSLIVAGSIITAMELTRWIPYDMEQNVANFDKETLKTTLSFEDLKTESILIANEYNIDFDYDDYLEGDSDFLEFEYYYGSDYSSRVNIEIDEKQEKGSVDIEYTYYSPFMGESCGIDSITFGSDDNRTEYRSHANGRGSTKHDRGGRHNSRNRSGYRQFYDEDTTVVFPQCRGFGNWGFGYNSDGSFYNHTFIEEAKAILKHKQIPINMSEMTVRVHPDDSHRVLSR